MVWRRYGGWWDGEFDQLLPAPKPEQAAEWIALAGGVKPVLDRARAIAVEGRHDLACHLAEVARHAAPDEPAVHEVRAAAYRANSKAQSSSMARHILNHAALASEKGRRDLASTD
jgi:alkyl sulfatase BDS1-like metallo-beta-lactamase superfamily hydrolase